MDTRIDLFPMLGIERGDAHIIRNAGGLATDDAIRSLSASQRLLGTEEIVVVMHEGCGSERCLRGRLPPHARRRRHPPDLAPRRLRRPRRHPRAPPWNACRSARELPHRDHIRGFVFNPEDGTLREATPPAAA